jgi:glutamate/aspartate transport system substrate-binding protein
MNFAGLHLRVAALLLLLLPTSPQAQTTAAPKAAAAATALAPAQSDTLRRIRDTGAILIGVREAAAPFSFFDGNKSPQGYSVDICLKVADAIKAELKMSRLEIKFVPVTSANRIPMLLEGKIDLECGSTTNTRERQKQVAFAYTTFVAGIKMLAKKSSNIKGIEDIRGKSIVVTKGTTSEKALGVKNDEQSLKLNILVAADNNESFRMVEEGKAVAFAMDDVLLYSLISKSKKPDDFAVVGKYLSVEPYAIMMRRDDPQLERVVNKALSDLFASGEIRKLYAKWFATRELTVPMNPLLKEAFSAPNTHPAWP